MINIRKGEPGCLLHPTGIRHIVMPVMEWKDGTGSGSGPALLRRRIGCITSIIILPASPQSMAQVHFFALSDRWSSAANNDAFCAEKIGKYYVFGVAEGLTDLPGADSASGIAITSLRESARLGKGTPAAILEKAVYDSETRIIAQAGKSPETTRDATHLSACLVSDMLDCTILDTGEGNAYLIGPDGIDIPQKEPVTVKPSSPVRNPEEVKKRTDIISHTLGEPHMLKSSDFVTVSLRDIFLLLSSGGLHDYVRKEKIAEIILRNGENVETSCEKLLQEAQSAGSERSITLVLVHGHRH
jgi:serine/threonine protein phosphatase PrpC